MLLAGSKSSLREFLLEDSSISLISSFSGFLNVYVKQQIEIKPIIPMAAGGNQEFMPIFSEKKIMYDDITLPIVPTALTQPIPKLLTLVGYN